MTGSLSNRIREFVHGKTYARTKAKYGTKKAQAQAVAAAYSSVKTVGEIHREASKEK